MKKILLILGILGLLNNCAKFDDVKKDYESDTKGLNRKVEVYTLDGKLLKTYDGIIRVRDTEEVNDRISLNLIYDNNKRVILENAIVIIEEKKWRKGGIRGGCNIREWKICRKLYSWKYKEI